MGVDVNLDRRVHADDAKAADDLGRVGDLLGAEEELGMVVLPLGEEKGKQSVRFITDNRALGGKK